ncbi:uncharacterized protein L199_001412 [Kwoniella botswanensis]|uniref:uncharacterized protein n=1 Tax=Kwoniella botswanensis TaxID=1268659 RepID=UPI00315D4C3C
MSAGVYTTPRERMFIAKMELLEAEQEERAKYKLDKRESRRRVKNSKAEEPVASSSRSVSGTLPSSILRKSATLPPPSSYQPPAPSSPRFTQKPIVPSSSAPCLPLPPAPIISQNTDFGPPIQLPSPATASTNGVRRRSSRVRFSDQQLQPTPNLNQTLFVSRSTSLKGLRRESSIDGLRQDLMQASSSLNGHRRPSMNSPGRSNSLGGKRSSMTSNRSSINSDPFNWTTSSFGSRSGSDVDITSEIDIGSRKQSLANTFEVDLNLDQLEDEFGLEMRDELGFKPQMLPYPKISKRLSRLSLESTNSSVWSSQDHVTNLSTIKNQDIKPIYSDSVDSPSVNSTLKETLERSSLDSIGSQNVNIDGQLRQSSQFSLEARIISSGAVSRKSSYAPSSSMVSMVENGNTSTPSSLRSSASENEQSSGIKTSISFQLPSTANALAYSSLLPTRRKLSGAIDGHIPRINRGGWEDPELGLSPRSGPIRVSGSLSTVSRRCTKLAEEVLPQPEVEQEQVDLAPELGAKMEDEHKQEVISETSHQEEMDFTEYQNGQSDATITPTKGHTRSESTLSAIMAFPIPPDRIIENVTVQVDTIVEQEIVSQVNQLAGEKVIEIALNSEITVPAAIEPSELQSGVDEQLVISLNSPFVEIPSTDIATLPSVLQIDFPHVDAELTRSTVTPRLETCPSSPELEDILRTVTRPRRARRSVRADDLNDTETEESDLDIASPLVKVALSSHILSPKSRLLSASSSSSPISRPGSIRSVSANSISTLSSLRSGLGLTSGRGWSGSESEEEDWISTVRHIRERKSLTPQKQNRRKSEGLTIQVEHDIVTPTQIKRLSTCSTTSTNSNNRNKSTNRYSQLSEISTITTTTTTSTATTESHLPITPLSLEMLTPSTVGLLTRTNSNASSTSSSQNNKIGNFPWGLSSPPDSPIRGLFVNNLSPTKEFFTSFRDTSRGKKGKRQMPMPTREDMLEDWGEPEILIDQLEGLPESDIEERSLRGSISTLSLKSDISVLAERYGGIESRRSTIKLSSYQKEEKRSQSPDMWMNVEGEKSLMDEEMPEI